MLWDCKKCGTQAIADSLDDCPVCTTTNPVSREDRTEEDRNPGRAAAAEGAEAHEDEPDTDVAAGQGDDPEVAVHDDAEGAPPDSFPAGGDVVDAPSSHELHDEEVPDGTTLN